MHHGWAGIEWMSKESGEMTIQAFRDDAMYYLVFLPKRLVSKRINRSLET